MDQTTNPSVKFCPDCGPVGVPHWIERWSARIDPVMEIATTPMQALWMGIRPGISFLKLDRVGPPFFALLAALGLGKIVTAPDEKNNWRAKVTWEEANKRGIVMKEFRPFGLARECFWAVFDGETRVYDGLPRPRSSSEKSLAWMDDKGIILKKFAAAGIPVPRGKSCRTEAEAEKVFREIVTDDNSAVIIKPHLGSRSRHTYVNITDVDTLRHDFLKAKELSPRPVVEEELRGFVFRVTLVGGTVAGVMRREAPHVMGDGKHTVTELVARANENPLRHGPIFHELHLDTDANAELVAQGLSADSVPATGRMVILNKKVSRAFGASTTEFSDAEIHPDNYALFLHIANVLDDPLVGVDFMIEDMGKSWREQKRCGVIECNSLPFIDLHHYPLVGTPRNVAGIVWDLIYPA